MEVMLEARRERGGSRSLNLKNGSDCNECDSKDIETIDFVNSNM